MSDTYDGTVWLPQNYNPGLSIEDWVSLLQDKTVFTAKDIEVVRRIKALGGIATCAELSKAFGEVPNHYNNSVWMTGRRIHKATGCPLCPEKDYKYWPILCVGRHIRGSRQGSYEWKLRKELSEAISIFEVIEQETEIRAMPLPQLEEAARQHECTHPVAVETTTHRIDRSPYISEYAKRKSKGVCQLCKQNAPFYDTNGQPYLESHHIVWLSKGGSDTIDNVVALCPNCHRKMHIVNNSDDVKTLQELVSS